MPALDGMRILDMTQYEAGTSGTQMLAWFGADVVKIEAPVTGDPGRRSGGNKDNAPYFLNLNANKRSIALNLRDPRGRDLLLRLAPHYDVFAENYGPGVIEKLDIGYDVLKQVNPRIVYARLKGYGLSGPYASFKGYDMVAQAMGAAYSVTGTEDGPPLRPGPTYGDTGSGLQLALGILAAYVECQRTGKGQHIELSMQEAVTYFMRAVSSHTDWFQRPAARRGNGGAAPTNLYPCKPFGRDDYVYIMIVTEKQWDELCAALDRLDLLTDPRFATHDARAEHTEELYEEVAKWTRERTKQEALEELGGRGAVVGATLSTSELTTDPHLCERNFIKQIDHPQWGTVPLMRNPLLMRGVVDIERSPLLAEHTDAVLSADLGLSADDLADLRSDGVIG